MKSSGPLLTRQNPVQPASRGGKAHSQSFRNQLLSTKKKKTVCLETLSPVHSKQQSGPQTHTLSSESQQPLYKSEHCFTATGGKPSWPSTDCASSPVSTATSSNTETPRQPARAGRSTVSSELGVKQDTVLAKYVERFRHGQPQSREERRQKASAMGEEQLPFWWMSPSSLPPSSTPTKTADKDEVIPSLIDEHMPTVFSPAGQHRCDTSLSPCTGSFSFLSDTSQGEFDETEILHLQERASRLLLRGSECPLSDGSFPVSSEGLGGSDLSSPVSIDEPVRRPLIPSLIKSTTVKARSVLSLPCQKSAIPSLGPPTCPEEDILYQWRLRRKMEQAREQPQTLQRSSLHDTVFNWQAPYLSQPSAGGQVDTQQQSTRPPGFSQKDTLPHTPAHQPETKGTQTTCPAASGLPPSPAFVVSSSSLSQPQTIAHVPAHMHFLCDVLPCPVQLSHASAQQNVSERLDEFQSTVVSKKTQVPYNPTDILTSEPIREHMSSSMCTSSGGKEEEPLRDKRSESNKKKKAQTKESEKNEKSTALSTRKQKKSTRYAVEREHTDGPSSTKRTSSHQRLPKKVMPLAAPQQQEGSQGSSWESCTRPVHSVLGQVVSEVLFPAVDSSAVRRSPVSSTCPPRTASAPPPPLLPPCDTQNSMEVISQLLQQAEDSDEKEFEDDTLLQVLRKQRQWVKEQISEVDCMLKEYLDEEQVT